MKIYIILLSIISLFIHVAIIAGFHGYYWDNQEATTITFNIVLHISIIIATVIRKKNMYFYTLLLIDIFISKYLLFTFVKIPNLFILISILVFYFFSLKNEKN